MKGQIKEILFAEVMVIKAGGQNIEIVVLKEC